MSQSLSLAEHRLLLPAGLDASGLDRAFGALLGPGIDFGDLYFQHSRRESWTVEDGIVKEGAHSIEQGVGVRAISGEKTGFAYSDDINTEALLEAAGSARAISRQGNAQSARVLVPATGRALYVPEDPIDGLGNEDKVEALRRVDRMLRAADPRVQQVMVSLSGGVDTVLIARSDGILAADVRPLVRINVQVIVEQNGRRESGYAGGGGRYSYAELLADGKPEHFAREALRQALVNLEAIDAPAGLACCCTRPSVTAWKAISTARAPRRMPVASASAWPRPASPSSTTARSKDGAVRSTSTTKARRRSARR
jgi:TldD protein